MWVLVRRRDRFLERGVIFGQGGKRSPVEERKIKKEGVKGKCASGTKPRGVKNFFMALSFLRNISMFWGSIFVASFLVGRIKVNVWKGW